MQWKSALLLLLSMLWIVSLAGCGFFNGSTVTPTPLPILIRTATPSPTNAPTTTPTPTLTPTVTPTEPATQGSRLQAVQERGYLICGVNGTLPGFSERQIDGSYTGFDVDFCRALAVAIFNNPRAVEFVELSAVERFEAVETGRVDVLFRNTTWTAERDSRLNLDFGPVIFHDGQGFMVPRNLNISLPQELEGMRICVREGTTHEVNLPDKFNTLGITYEPVIMADEAALYQAYEQGQCEAMTADRSALAAQRTKFQNPDDHMLLDYLISREPLGPAYPNNDPAWRDVVQLVCYALLYAEELGVDSTTLAEKLNVTDRQTLRLLGVEGTVGQDLGLENDFVQNMIRTVGNYEEIYNRNVGPDTLVNIERGPNKIWNKGQGGLFWSPTW